MYATGVRGGGLPPNHQTFWVFRKLENKRFYFLQLHKKSISAKHFMYIPKGIIASFYLIYSRRTDVGRFDQARWFLFMVAAPPSSSILEVRPLAGQRDCPVQYLSVPGLGVGEGREGVGCVLEGWAGR